MNIWPRRLELKKETTKTNTPTKTISKIYTKSNYDRLKTIIRETNENYYHTRAIYDPLIIWRLALKRGPKPYTSYVSIVHWKYALPLLVFNFVVYPLNHEIGFPLEMDVSLRVSTIEIALPVTITWGGLCRAVVVFILLFWN